MTLLVQIGIGEFDRLSVKSPMLDKGSDSTVCNMALAAATAIDSVSPAAQSF